MIEAKAVPYEKRMTLGKVISFAFSKFFKEVPAVGQWVLLVILLALINVIPIGLIVFSVMGSGNYVPALSAGASSFQNANLALMIPGALLMFLAFIVDIGFGIFTLAWFNRLGLDAFDGEKRIFGERFKLALKDTYRLVAPFLLLSLFGMLAMVPNYITSAIDIGNGVNGDMMPFTSTVATLFYFMALIVIYFVSVRVVATYGLLLENPDMQVMEGFKESFAMTKGRGWRIFGYMIVLVILVILACIALFIPCALVWVAVLATGGNIGVAVIATVVSVVLYIVMAAIASGVSGLMTAGVYKFLLIEHSEDKPQIESVVDNLESVEIEKEDQE